MIIIIEIIMTKNCNNSDKNNDKTKSDKNAMFVKIIIIMIIDFNS